MKINKVSEDIFIDDFYRTFYKTDRDNEEIKESVKAIYALLQLPIYNKEENAFIACSPFGIDMLPDEHIIIPLGFESDTMEYNLKSMNNNYTAEAITQTGDIFVHLHNTSSNLISFEPDQVIVKIIGK